MRDLLSASTPLLEDLLPATVNRKLIDLAVRHRFADGQLIHSRGDQKQGLSIVRKGRVRVGNVGRDGSYLTTSTLETGQCLGEFTLFAGLPRTHDATAVGETEIDQISKIKFLGLFEAEPQLSKSLLTIALFRNHALLEFMDDLRRLPLDVRVAKFIQSASVESLELSVRQEELAFTFGVSRVSMGKVLKKLQSLQLIKLGYGKIGIPDDSNLKQWLHDHTLVTPLAQESLN